MPILHDEEQDPSLVEEDDKPSSTMRQRLLQMVWNSKEEESKSETTTELVPGKLEPKMFMKILILELNILIVFNVLFLCYILFNGLFVSL